MRVLCVQLRVVHWRGKAAVQASKQACKHAKKFKKGKKTRKEHMGSENRLKFSTCFSPALFKSPRLDKYVLWYYYFCF